MNVIYLSKDKLPLINVADINQVNLSKVFSSMKQGCVFVVDDKKRLVGYINDTTYKKSVAEETITINNHYRTLVSDSEAEIIGSEVILKDDNRSDILAVVDCDGNFKGAFIRTFPEELVSYDRLMLQVALASLPAFADELVEYLEHHGINNILLAGDEEDYESIIKAIGAKISIAQYTNYLPLLDNKGTLIIDLIYSKSYRKQEFFQWQNAMIAKLDDILAASMVDSLFDYIKSRNAQIVFIEGPIKEKLRNAKSRWPTMFNDSSLATCIENKVLLNDFCNGKTEIVNWMQDPENGTLAGAQITTNGIHLLTADFVGDKCTCLDGVRISKRINENAPTIHMYGPCLTFGSCVPDSYTIQYYLYEVLEENNVNCNVLNHGVKNGHSNLNDFLYIFNTELKHGDIVICLNAFSNFVADKVLSHTKIYCSSDYLNDIDDIGMKYLDMSFHVNFVVNKLISQYIYYIIQNQINQVSYYNGITLLQSYLLETGKISRIESSSILSKGLLRTYVEYLKRNKKDVPEDAVVGSVLITANPITKGHEYLIAHAKQNCDVLYVFIVEEDKFYFSTAERMLLVKEVINDPNIIIVTTGTLMTAKFTFPEYFTKDKANIQQSANQMPQLHFQIFGGVVAPLLGITKRFVGTEVLGSVTDVYNKKLMKYLPSYGVEVEIINRLERKDGIQVSASDTRRMIEAGEFDNLYLNLSEPVVKYITKKWKEKR